MFVINGFMSASKDFNTWFNQSGKPPLDSINKENRHTVYLVHVVAMHSYPTY